MEYDHRDLMGSIMRAKVAAYRQALSVNPGYSLAHSALMSALYSFRDSTTEEAQAERRRWYEVNRLTPYQHWTRDWNPRRRIKVGYLAGEFRHHSAAYGFAPLLFGYDRDQFEVHCFSTSKKQDDSLTEKFRAAVDGFHEVKPLSPVDLAAFVRTKDIDILVDLAGHPSHNRLAAFTAKPAPVQASGWGDLSGTGIPEIDYLFSDFVVIPQAERHLYAETIYDLPCALSYMPGSWAPDIAPAPLERNGYVTFGFLGRISKTDDQQLQLWARVLREVPNSRFVLKCKRFSDDEAFTKALIRRFFELGVNPDRLDIRGNTTQTPHLAAHNDVDVILDSLPCNGGVSLIEALWMGLPVVSQVGKTVGGRVSRSVLRTIGYGFLATTDDEYVAFAKELADGLSKLDSTLALRISIRDAVAKSWLTRPVPDVEAAYREMWARRCHQETES